MITILVDHNIEGHAERLFSTLKSLGLVEMGLLRFVTFQELSLAVDTSDREVWRFAQERGLLLLTGNRNMTGNDSLEQAIRDENRLDSTPVVTIANLDRVFEGPYREKCAWALASICGDIDTHIGRGRLFIP